MSPRTPKLPDGVARSGLDALLELGGCLGAGKFVGQVLAKRTCRRPCQVAQWTDAVGYQRQPSFHGLAVFESIKDCGISLQITQRNRQFDHRLVEIGVLRQEVGDGLDIPGGRQRRFRLPRRIESNC